jgi:4-amino-4-deoxy-L-arabinose transferase-like glycosyltransferase
MKPTTPRSWIILLAAIAAASVLRSLVAYNGSLWADEGSFLNVIAASSWREMIDFLRLHESHPPLFYALMRTWSRMIGGTDSTLMIAPIVLAVAIVPAMYVAGRVLFSERIALVAAVLAAIAPQLTEHSSQIRPYGLLSLGALASAVSLIVSLTSNTRRAWAVYVVATTTILYTHNWAWAIILGELATVLIYLRAAAPDRRRVLLRNGILAWCAILAMYAPWIPSFLYQTAHAGHGSMPIDNHTEYIGYWLFASFRILESLVIGRLSARQPTAVVELIVGVVALIVVGRLYRGIITRSQPVDELARRNARMCFQISAFAVLVALIVSPFSNLILPRGLATVMPTAILASAWWLDKIARRQAGKAEAQAAAIAFSVVFVAGAFETHALLERPRSNIEKIVGAVQQNVRPTDMLILAPEWFAASFDHYFPPSIEQVDYPYTGRSGMINFSNVWETRSKSSSFDSLKKRMDAARNENRRVWFVFERRYVRNYTEHELEKAFRHKLTGIFSVTEVRRIRSALDSLYGGPARVFEARDPLPINDEMIAYLYGH